MAQVGRPPRPHAPGRARIAMRRHPPAHALHCAAVGLNVDHIAGLRTHVEGIGQMSKGTGFNSHVKREGDAGELVWGRLARPAGRLLPIWEPHASRLLLQVAPKACTRGQDVKRRRRVRSPRLTGQGLDFLVCGCVRSLSRSHIRQGYGGGCPSAPGSPLAVRRHALLQRRRRHAPAPSPFGARRRWWGRA
jgi:hypothetical protein